MADARTTGAPINAKGVSVIVPTIGRPDSLLALLDSLAAQSLRPDELVVADGSRDGEVAGTLIRRSAYDRAGGFSDFYPDAAGGFRVKKRMAGGSPWNHMTEPRADDIAKDHSYFYAMWSPGPDHVGELQDNLRAFTANLPPDVVPSGAFVR